MYFSDYQLDPLKKQYQYCWPIIPDPHKKKVSNFLKQMLTVVFINADSNGLIHKSEIIFRCGLIHNLVILWVFVAAGWSVGLTQNKLDNYRALWHGGRRYGTHNSFSSLLFFLWSFSKTKTWRILPDKLLREMFSSCSRFWTIHKHILAKTFFHVIVKLFWYLMAWILVRGKK